MSFIIGLLFCVIACTQSQELKNGTACKEELLQLICANDEVLVIHQAVFDGQDSEGCGFLMPINISSLLPPNLKNLTEEDEGGRRFSVQSTVNRRCSGFNNCTIQLENDEPQAKQWGNGKLHVLYNCIPVKSARFSCDTIIEITTPESSSSSSSSSSLTATVNIDDEEVKPKWYPGPQQVPGWGYLHNMGYPEYYRGGSSGPVDCRWTIRASHGRRVRLTFLDLSIRSVIHGEVECKDVLTVTEHSRLLLNKCGQAEEPLVVESFSDEINITLSVKSQFISKRGLMVYFTAMGCPTPRTPKQSYLVSGSNSSRAAFICSVDHVFPDTGLRFRNLTCLEQEGHRWNEDLPDCVDVKHMAAGGNKSLLHILQKANRSASEPEVGELTNYSLTYDLIVPTSIIAGLIVGNLVVLAGVIHCRRRNRKLGGQKVEGGEESVPLQETPGPSDLPAAATAQSSNRVGTPV